MDIELRHVQAEVPVIDMVRVPRAVVRHRATETFRINDHHATCTDVEPSASERVRLGSLCAEIASGGCFIPDIPEPGRPVSQWPQGRSSKPLTARRMAARAGARSCAARCGSSPRGTPPAGRRRSARCAAGAAPAGPGTHGPSCLTPINTTEVFIIQAHELEADEEVARAAGRHLSARQGSHLKVFLNGKQSTLPMHGTAELGKGLEAAIRRQLGLK
jgi:mRNA interferase HicA